MTYNRRYDQEPCSAWKDAAELAQAEGTKAGKLNLAAGLNPYPVHSMLGNIWEECRSEAAASYLPDRIVGVLALCVGIIWLADCFWRIP